MKKIDNLLLVNAIRLQQATSEGDLEMTSFPFTARFDDKYEYMCVHVPMNWEYIKNPIGTWLLDLLNADLEHLEDIVGSYQLDDTEKMTLIMDGSLPAQDSPPPNIDEIYHEIVTHFSFMRAYAAQEWESIYCQIALVPYNYRCLRIILGDIKEMLDACIDKPEFFDYAFLSRYMLGEIIDTSVDCTAISGCRQHVLSSEDYCEMEHASIANCLDIAYSKYQKNGIPKSTDYFYKNLSPRLEGIVYSSIFEVARNGKIIRKCKNCGKYFIPSSRSDTLYCDNVSPQNGNMTCKQFGSQRLWYERQKDDVVATLSRNILSAKSMLAKRNQDIPEFTQSYDYFRAERKEWKKAVEKGSRSREEYQAWLLLMQSQKVIKEAIGGNESK